MPGYIQNPYMPQYGGFQYGNYPMQPNAPYQTPTTYPTFNPQPQTISNSADALVKSDISGKIVDTENDISVNDIPMDGKVHLFILKDYSKVIGKAWTADGKIATQQAINADTVANMQNTNALSTQLAQCCCENRQGQAQIQYDMATNTCAIQNAIQNQTQQIIQNDNANYRQLHDEIVANRMEDLKSKIADQAQEINQLNLSASQCQQNAYLISQLRPSPIPAFQVANPFASMYTGCCNNNVAI